MNGRISPRCSIVLDVHCGLSVALLQDIICLGPRQIFSNHGRQEGRPDKNTLRLQPTRHPHHFHLHFINYNSHYITKLNIN